MTKPVNEYVPTRMSHPGETLEEMLAERRIRLAEFAIQVSWPVDDLLAILRGKAPITDLLAHRLAQEFPGLPESFWITRQRRHDEFMAQKRMKRAA